MIDHFTVDYSLFYLKFSCFLLSLYRCWLCFGAWKDHQNCAVYGASGANPSAMNLNKERSEMKSDLERYIFHWERFSNHQNSIKFAHKTRINAQKKMNAFQDAEKNINPKSVSFILDAVDAVIRCKQVLRWTYVFSYLFKGTSSMKALFESQQALLEEFTDQLHELAEKPISELVDSHAKIDLISRTRLIEKYRENLMDAITKSRQTS